MSNLWRKFREFRRNPTESQTQPLSTPEATISLESVNSDVNENVAWSNISLGSGEEKFDEVYENEPSVPDREPISVPTVRTPDDEGLSDLVEMQQTLIVQMQKDNRNLAQCLMEKDASLAEKNKILAEKEREIRFLQQTALVDEYDTFEVEYWRNIHCEQQEKFLALYHHARKLAEDRDAMVEVEKRRKVIIKQQVLHIRQLNNRVASLVHEDNIEHLARQQNITTYSSSDTASVSSTTRDSQDELSIDARRQDEADGVSRMLGTVDRLARHYSPPDRYHDPSLTNVSQPRLVSDPERLPNCVPQEMFAIWLHAHEEDLTPEEKEGFDKFLNLQLRPPPIHSPHLKKPFVNWNKLNPFQYKNLPKPDAFPIQGCSPDPKFYEATERDDESRTQRVKWTRTGNTCPFGWLFGFDTNMGTVAVPDQVIHGYRCEPRSGNWVIDAKG